MDTVLYVFFHITCVWIDVLNKLCKFMVESVILNTILLNMLLQKCLVFRFLFLLSSTTVVFKYLIFLMMLIYKSINFFSSWKSSHIFYRLHSCWFVVLFICPLILYVKSCLNLHIPYLLLFPIYIIKEKRAHA